VQTGRIVNGRLARYSSACQYDCMLRFSSYEGLLSVSDGIQIVVIEVDMYQIFELLDLTAGRPVVCPWREN